MLVVTTTERMLYGVLCHTSNLGPAVPLDGVLMESASGLEQRLVGTSSAGHDANLGANVRGDGLLASRGKTKAGGALLIVVGDDHGEAAGSAGKGAAIAHLGLDVADNGTLGNLLQWQDIANGQGCLLTAVDELTRVHALGGHHELGVALEAVGIEELDLGHGRSSAGIVEDFLDDAADVSPALGVVDGSELDGTLARAGVGLEDGGFTLSLALQTQHYHYGDFW